MGLEKMFTNICNDEHGVLLGNCIICNCKGVIIQDHKKFHEEKEQEYDRCAQLVEDNRISETMMAMNNPKFFEQ